VKRKRADRANWQRVKRCNYQEKWVETEAFTGYAVQLQLLDVEPPAWMHTGGRELCVADDGYVWRQYFPHGCNYAVTKMLDAQGKVVQWYIDICKQHGRDENGVLWYDDLYLDIVVFPDGEVHLLDQEELDEALEKGWITREEHMLSERTAARLLEEIALGERKGFDFPDCFE
jgi:predicted RNA-binding protein associated with RNAse of E/G family